MSNVRGTFLVRGATNLTGAIVLGLQVVIVVSHAIENDQKQFSRHPIAVTKFLLFIEQINRVELVLVQAHMASFSIAIDVVLLLLRRTAPARRQEELLNHHAGSGHQKIDLAIGRRLEHILVECPSCGPTTAAAYLQGQHTTTPVSMPTPTGTREDQRTYLNFGQANGQTGCGQGPSTRPEGLPCRLLLVAGGGGACCRRC
jgi:hypothetical protein